MQVFGQGLKLIGEAELLSLQLLKTRSKGEGEYILEGFFWYSISSGSKCMSPGSSSISVAKMAFTLGAIVECIKPISSL